jgi:hypothetical protein
MSLYAAAACRAQSAAACRSARVCSACGTSTRDQALRAPWPVLYSSLSIIPRSQLHWTYCSAGSTTEALAGSLPAGHSYTPHSNQCGFRTEPCLYKDHNESCSASTLGSLRTSKCKGLNHCFRLVQPCL